MQGRPALPRRQADLAEASLRELVTGHELLEAPSGAPTLRSGACDTGSWRWRGLSASGHRAPLAVALGVFLSLPQYGANRVARTLAETCRGHAGAPGLRRKRFLCRCRCRRGALGGSRQRPVPVFASLSKRSGKVSAEATGPTSLRVSSEPGELRQCSEVQGALEHEGACQAFFVPATHGGWQGWASAFSGWPPFQRLPGISCLEYALRCEPLAIDSDAAQASAPSGGSGASRRERVESLCFLHEPRRPDAQVLASAQFQRLLDQPEMSLARLASCFQDIRLAEAEEEKDLQLQVELTGLLPWTSYGLSVAARYPAGAGLYPHHGQTEGQKKSEALGPLRPLLGPALTVEVETPGGENAPGAPQEVDPGSVSCEASSFLTHPGLRGIFLSIEDRSDYALEYCAAAPAWAHYDAEVGQALRSFQGSWPRRREAGAWKRVSTVHRLQEIPSAAAGELKEASATSLAPSKVIILAVLPAFGQPGPIPDAVRFRLCAVDRGAAHPCRWAGGVSEPLAVAFAPPRRPPRIQRILSDDRWTLSLQIELFQHQPPPTPTCYLGLRTGTEDTEDDSECEEEEAKELLELRRAQLLPALRPESWQETALDSMPWGYGHRLVTMVQARCSLQSSVLPEHRMDLEREVLSSEWQLSAALELGGGPAAGAAGATTFELPALASGLLDGGVYAFQVRVGNGKTWSEWSHTSIPFLFQVPPPIPPTAASLKAQKTVTVEVMSATAARVVWGDFKPAPGLTLLEYEVRATPRQETSGRPLGAKAFPSQALTFQHRYRGGFIEHELLNLLPFTTYTFSVQARYPKVGMRLWSGQQVTEPVVLEPAVAYQEGVQYDLEYAFVLGDDLDTAEMRVANSLWRSPREASSGVSPSFACAELLGLPLSALSSFFSRLPVAAVDLSLCTQRPEAMCYSMLLFLFCLFLRHSARARA
ncbi:unnamed protein product [Symbiodinium sp. CCMP2592]|nr:unnamed protein product [Symbiodinium sp. CCMP2592]